MSDIMEEISEDLRRQQLEQFWKENGAWIIGGVFLAVVFTAGLTWWRAHTFERNLRETAQLIEIINESDVEKLSSFADRTDKDHAVIARLAAAAVYAKRQQPEKAVAIYTSIQNTTGVDRTYRELARLLSVGQRLETGDPAALHKDLKELTGKGDTWRFSALELEALLYARERKLKEAAASLAEIIADSSAPQDVRMRASTLREFYVGAAEGK
ncbi:MAG: tetratricopeptide repeat protein [Alphaproteobacteria bacterium]|nr:MAG: tetratricopeptide repeat protein [Alphaproteobacteria bacterium]